MGQWLRAVIGLACATGALGLTVQAQSPDLSGGRGLVAVTESLAAGDMGTWTSLSGTPFVKVGHDGALAYGKAVALDAQGSYNDETAQAEANANEKNGAKAGAEVKAKSKEKSKEESTEKSEDKSKDKSKEKNGAKSDAKSKGESAAKAKSNDEEQAAESSADASDSQSDKDKKEDTDKKDKKDKKSRFLPADQKKVDAAQAAFDKLAGKEKPVDKVKEFEGFPAAKGYKWIKVEDVRRDELTYLKKDALAGTPVPNIKSLENMQAESPLTYLENSSFQEPDMDITGLMYGSVDNALNIYGKDSKVISENGPYTVYDFPGGTFTTYRPELPNGTFETPYITSVHVVNHSFAMGHDVRVGSTRSQVLFAYGAPNAMYRRAQDSDEILYLYVSPRLLTMGYKLVPEKDGLRVADLDLKAVGGYAKYVPMSVVTPKYDGPMVKPTTEAGYVVFTFKNDRVTSIDSFRAQSFPWKSFPRLELRTYPLGYVNGSDFRLMGHTVGDTFTGEPNVSWLSRGTYSGDSKQEAITYKDLVFVYNDKRKVNRIFIARSFNAMTPRGVTIGDSRNLMLFLYGVPSYPAYESKDGEDMMYVYMQPEHYNKYLVFTVNKKTGFISDIELTSVAPKKVIAMQDKKGKAKEEFMDILANPEKAKKGEL